MPISPVVKDRARKIDPKCWDSYSGQNISIKRGLEARRQLALQRATAELEKEGFDKFAEFAAVPDWSTNGVKLETASYGNTTQAELDRGPEAKHASPEERIQVRYTVGEIDRMRKAINKNPRLRINPFRRSSSYGIPGINTSDAIEHTENLLRTYMLNGTMPAELEEAADLEWELVRERRTEREALFEAVRRPYSDYEKAVQKSGIAKEAPFVAAQSMTCDLPLPQTERKALRAKIEDAIKRTITGWFS
jgi:DNA-binding protein H-NS